MSADHLQFDLQDLRLYGCSLYAPRRWEKNMKITSLWCSRGRCPPVSASYGCKCGLTLAREKVNHKKLRVDICKYTALHIGIWHLIWGCLLLNNYVDKLWFVDIQQNYHVRQVRLVAVNMD